jgi:endonuclease YncB( thermonuclease family)
MKINLTNIVKYFIGVLIVIGISYFSRFFLEHKPEKIAKDRPKTEKREKNSKNLDSISTDKITEKVLSEEKGFANFIPDGDTIHLKNGLKVRLLGVNCPEIYHDQNLAQKFGKEAKAFLSTLITNKELIIKYNENNKLDQYQRLLGEVYVGSENINLEMIKNGYAFVYSTSPDEIAPEFYEAEKQAQEKKLGLWGVENDVAVFEKFAPKFESGELVSFVDKTVLVSGTITKYSKNKGAVVMLVQLKEDLVIRVVLSKKNYIHFPGLSSAMFLNKKISLIGRVSQYKENVEVSIRYPTQFILR